jgi:putative CocE/NonD family hydrolase
MTGSRLLALACAAVAALAGGAARAGASVTTADPTFEVEKRSNVVVPMADGTKLVADVYVPKAAAGVRFPCLLEASAYRKESRAAEAADYFPPRGFAFVELDLRGTGGSEGRFDGIHSVQEQRDGAAAVEWVAAQPWCNGKVGLFGGSWTGGNQFLIAAQRPPHLAAIAPQRAVTSDFYRDVWYVGGQLSLTFGATWAGAVQGFNAIGADPSSGPDAEVAAQALADHTTTAEPLYEKYVEQPFDGPLYRQSSMVDRFADVRVPVLNIEGWYDAFLTGHLRAFSSMLRLERDGRVPGPNFMMIGPWSHSETHALKHPETTERLLGFYRHYLDGTPRPAWMDGPRLTYFEQHEARDGAGVWRTAAGWPLPRTTYRRWYLQAGGRLDPARPPRGAAPATYLFEPSAGLTETASKWWDAFGPPATDVDQRPDQAKALTWATAPLARDKTVTGPMVLSLDAATEPLVVGAGVQEPTGLGQQLPPYHDTDWVAKLVDVAPDGSATLIQSGRLRASHRRLDPRRTVTQDGEVIAPWQVHTREALEPPRPGVPLNYKIEIWPTAKRFAKGHRIGLALYSSDTPSWATLLKPARDTVFEDRERASYLLLPEQAP